MKNIKILGLEKHKDSEKYEPIENGIYRDLKDEDNTNYRIAICFELENEEDKQYPIEDLLDKYFLYVSDFLQSKNAVNEESFKILKLELGGELEDIKNVSEIIGKRVYYNNFIGEDGQTHVNLKIE